jgi:RNA methyltransferase, TrmH family
MLSSVATCQQYQQQHINYTAGNFSVIKFGSAHTQVTTINLDLQYMLSKAQNKHIRSLTQQKFRNEYSLFVAEGVKVANEWLQSANPVQMILATELWAVANMDLISRHPEATLHIISDTELSTLSTLQTPNQVLLVVPYPEAKSVPILNEWYLALDDIQDPGNMGTIIRIADWFGINHIICSHGCVDVYNPKVVQSAMGGHLRVAIYEAELTDVLLSLPLPRFAATLGGSNVYDAGTHNAGVLIIGNESKGISGKVAAMATHHITIPRRGRAESLNAGVSAGILCALLLSR